MNWNVHPPSETLAAPHPVGGSLGASCRGGASEAGQRAVAVSKTNTMCSLSAWIWTIFAKVATRSLPAG